MCGLGRKGRVPRSEDIYADQMQAKLRAVQSREDQSETEPGFCADRQKW